MADEINKLPGTTPDLTELNTEKVKELFPQAVTEGKIDFDTLKSLLGEEVDDSHEKYQFTWHGKSKAIKLAQSPSSATLRPSKDDSKNWDTTENLYIEGDNLEVLKQLQKTYFGKIKMIYIDPPYNTGGDFVYKDDFKDTIKNYKEQTNQLHKANAETSGRYHTDWLNMMYPRLMLAKNLLSDDGVIFISIDDSELTNLTKIGNEIFGEKQLLAKLVWTNKEGGGGSDSKNFKIKQEYIVVYCKRLDLVKINGVPITDQKRYKLSDKYVETRGKHQLIKLESGSLGYVKSLDYPIEAPDGTQIWPNTDNNKIKRWRWSEKRLKKGLIDDLVVFKKDSNNNWIVYTKQYTNMDKDGHIIARTNRPTGIIDTFSSTQATKKIIELMDGRYFDYPKPVDLLKWLISRLTFINDSYILDFFSGSATTAHAVMKLNAEDGGNRKFIMVQLPELTDEKSEAHKAGYKNICEIGKERIRRAGKQIQEELAKEGKAPSNLDVGFKVFKLDSTNIKEWDSSQALEEPTLLEYADIFKDGRTEEDVLYEILLKYGVFNMPVKEILLNDKTAYDIAEGNTLICLADDINEEDVQAIGKLKPQNVIFKESGFKDDNVKLNAIYTLEKQGVEDIQAI